MHGDWLQEISAAAQKAGHVWPFYAACEAALESNFGTSQLAADDNNLFGIKQHRHAIYGTVNLPTREFENSEWITVDAPFIHYPDLPTCFADRMVTLQRLAPVYPHYAAALAATTGEDYILQVSKTWSTDPDRASKVLAIYHEYAAVLA